MHRTRILKFSGNISPPMIPRPPWMTLHQGFSTEAPGPNGMNVTTALPYRRFRGERFPASIPQPSPISFLPSIENISEVYRLFLLFESPVPCTSVFTFRVPRQWKPGLFSGSSRLRFASGRSEEHTSELQSLAY